MILDLNDPTGIGLFSRCARNQACKNTKSRPHTAGSRKSSASSLKIQQQKKKNNHSQNWFAKQQSRQQRQSKYKLQTTPSVGQYNPTTRQRPKLVWDVIKLYQKKNRQMKKLEEIKQKIKVKYQQDNETIGKSKQKTSELRETLEQSAVKMDLSGSLTNKMNRSLEQEIIVEENSLQNLHDRNRQKTSSSHKSACVVNMSRMTGRASVGLGKQSLTINTNSRYLDISQMKSTIDKIKPKTTKNVYFKRMLGRRQDEKKSGTANMYDCKFDLIKSRRSAQLNFGILKGRQQSPRKNDQSSSYIHYDYNQYVWKSNSSVYPNTKRHLISFQKQM